MGKLAGKRWLPRKVAELCYGAGWTDIKHLSLFVATIGGESDFYDEAEGDPHTDGTIDLGLFQLNSLHAPTWHLSASEFREMAFTPKEAVKYARKLWDADVHAGGSGLRPWFAFSDGGYKKHLIAAIVGAANFVAVDLGYDPDIRWK